MSKIVKIYYVSDYKEYNYLMKELEDKRYLWQKSFGENGDRHPTTKSFNPEWTWGFPVFVYLYDDKTIAYEPTEEDEDEWGIPEEYSNLIERYNGAMR